MNRWWRALALLACAASSVGAEPDGESVERGRRVFDQSTCGSCHAKGDSNGPDLGSEGERHRSGEWLVEQITAPERHNPDTIMPSQKLRPEDLSALIAWLQAQRVPIAAAPSVRRDGQALFQARCKTCHFLPVPETYAFTDKEWPLVVDFMLEGKKASRFVRPEERDPIVEYLVSVARKKEASHGR